MHCGPHKGIMLQDFVQERYNVLMLDPASRRRPFCIVELGSYCGYSAICMAQGLLLLQQQLMNNSSCTSTDTQPTFHIYSIDIHPKLLRIAEEITRLAGMDHVVSHHLLRYKTADDTSALHNLLDTILAHDEPAVTISSDNNLHETIDFLFLDHDKDLYLSDLQQLERYGWLRTGSAVAADNVVFANIHGYRSHVLSADYIRTRLVESPLEYQDEIADGIGTDHMCVNVTCLFLKTLLGGTELSVYTQDPIIPSIGANHQ
jgi:catechol O-methyltransferase